jgi:membrane associated rhomboid family serine protease
VTWGLIAANVLVFLVELWLGERFVCGYSMVPYEITHRVDLDSPPHAPGPQPIYLTLLTSLFLHAGWEHLIGNMWFLGVLGRNVERGLGRLPYLLFYLVCGLGGHVFQIAQTPHSKLMCLGASGAISGVVMGHLLLYPTKQVRFWMGPLMGIIEAPALLGLGCWGVLQFLYAYISNYLNEKHGEMGGVGYMAHVGGLVAGGLVLVGSLVRVFRKTGTEQAAPTNSGPRVQLTALNLEAAPGQALDIVLASFTDREPNTSADRDYAALIDWGDGSTRERARITAVPGGGFAISGCHTYTRPEFYAVGVFLLPRALKSDEEVETIKAYGSVLVRDKGNRI